MIILHHCLKNAHATPKEPEPPARPVPFRAQTILRLTPESREGVLTGDAGTLDEDSGPTMKNAWKSSVPSGALLILITVTAYWPALSGRFNWDDDWWTTRIYGLLVGFSGLRSIWLDPTAMQQYYPLTGTSFCVDYHLWGFRPLPYHLENVLLHAASAILLWRLLRRLQVPGAWLAGAIFAVHPVAVESVAWITERKNVLSLVFYLGALLAYGRFSFFWKAENNPAAGAPQRWSTYAWALVLFVAALLAKATAFSLPAVILLIGWWKRGRIRWRPDVLPTAPFFAAAIGFGSITTWLEKNHVGANGPDWVLSFPERCLVAGRVLWFYSGKLLWPAKLCFIYPRWPVDPGSWWQWSYPVSAVGVLTALWLARKRIGRGPVTAALFFVGTLFPVLGFMNGYFMRFSFVWDHLVYVSMLGLIALVAALVAWTAERLRAKPVLVALSAALVPLLAFLTWRECGKYADVETLWRDTLAKNPACWMAHYNLGQMLQISGNTAEAKEHYEQALYFKPDCDEALNNLAWLLGTLPPAQGGDPTRALTLARRACELTSNRDPDSLPDSLDTLAVAYAANGRFDDAIATTQQAIALARAGGQAELIRKMESRLTLYRRGLAYH
ncbi:MAG TPA: tetratricopeptide repeat protein [Verrucomicrobiae bacterium]|nr:tetratricopeptide repeat protein [Verrucomicrobiae bacterium]